MGKRESYEPGTFCWVDLQTSDPDAAKAFYGELFGWSYEDNEMGEGMTYSMPKVGDALVGGLFAGDETPPHWNSYVSVESVDDTVAKAKDAGAAVVAEAVTVGESGRMAVLQDPSGAVVALWEPDQLPGAALVNAPGALCWNDLMTHDVEKAKAFYAEVFQWELGEVEGAPDDRHGIRVGEHMNGGMARIPEAAGTDVMPHWLVCFCVEDAAAALEQVESGGGAKMSPVIDLPSGRFAVAADPQGAVFGLVDGDMDD